MNTYQRNIIFALLIATFLSAIEATVISTAMPVIAQDLGGLDLISWVFAAYLLTYAVLTPVFGKLADLYGRKRIFIIGTTIFLIGSAMCGLSQSMGQLIFFRALQGIGAGAITPMSFTIVGDVFKFEQRAKAQGIIGSVWGIAGIAGPLVGGFFVDYLSWHWIFFFNIPFGLLAMFLIGKYLKEDIEKKKHSIDYKGAITFIVGVGTLLYALLSSENGLNWADPSFYILFGVSLIFLILFIFIQLRAPEPMLPLYLFKNKHLLVANICSFLLGAVLIGMTAYLPLWVQGVLLLPATASGLTLIPMSLGWPLGSNLCGKFMVKLGTKGMSLTGVILIALFTGMLTLISSTTPNFVIVLIMFFVGLGFGLSVTIFTVIVQSSVEWGNRGTASSTNSFLRTFGQTVGIAILGSILNLHIGGSINDGTNVAPDILSMGLHYIFVVLTIIAALAVVFAAFLPKELPGNEDDASVGS